MEAALPLIFVSVMGLSFWMVMIWALGFCYRWRMMPKKTL